MRHLGSSAKVLGIALATAAAFAPAAANAESYDVQIRAYVPIECEADLTGSVQQTAPNSFRLGNVKQFCNTPFRMSLIHSSLAPGATFQFKGNIAQAGASETVLNASLSAANDTSALYIYGVDTEAATNLAQAMVLSVTPLGV